MIKKITPMIFLFSAVFGSNNIQTNIISTIKSTIQNSSRTTKIAFISGIMSVALGQYQEGNPAIEFIAELLGLFSVGIGIGKIWQAHEEIFPEDAEDILWLI